MDGGTHQQANNNQSSSILLTHLPPEIRHKIYAYVLLSPSSSLIHIALVKSPSCAEPRRLSSRRCSAHPPELDVDPTGSSTTSPDFEDPDDDAPPLVYSTTPSSALPSGGNGERRRTQLVQRREWCPFGRAYELPKHDDDNDEGSGARALALLSTCKIIHAEAAPLLFTHAVWSACGPAAFLALQRMVKWEHWTALNHVRLDCEWFEPGWDGLFFDHRSGGDANSERWFARQEANARTWSAFWYALAACGGEAGDGRIVGEGRVIRGGGPRTLKVWVDCHADFALGEPSVQGSQWVRDMLECGLCRVREVEVRLKWKMYVLGMRSQKASVRLSSLEERIREVWMCLRD